MLKKCVFLIIVLMMILSLSACELIPVPSTTPPPAPPAPSPPEVTQTKPEVPQPVPKEEYLELSAYEATKKLSDTSLTQLQREELWRSYEGKQVRWISQLQDVEPLQEETIVTFSPSVQVIFDKNQRSLLLSLAKGDLVIYSGKLDSYRRDSIRLTDGAIMVPKVLVLIWSKDFEPIAHTISPPLVGDNKLYVWGSDSTGERRLCALIVETGETIWQRNFPRTENLPNRRYIDHFDYLIGVDEHHVYITGHESSHYFGTYAYDRFSLEALDKETGQTVWYESYKYESAFELYRSKERSSKIGELLQQKGIKLVLEPDGNRQKTTDDIAFDVMGRTTLCALDSKSEKTIWTKGWGKPIDFVGVSKGILYVFSGKELEAFKPRGMPW